MEIEGFKKIDLDPEARSCRDDNQFSETNRADLTTCDLAEALDAQKEVDLGIYDHVLLPERQKSREVERGQTKAKYNLRKSLAWDSAFFTSAGVLDAEELSSMITGADKVKKHSLPGIEEDVTGSTESISTLESDNLNLETLEEELFVDIRASIQRSNKKVPDVTNSSAKKADVEVGCTPISSLKNEAINSNSQDKNLKLGSKRTSGQETVLVSKSPAKHTVGKQGSRKVIKQDSGHSQMTSLAKISEKNPTHNKISKTISNSISTSTTAIKRDSMGIGRGKSERGSSKYAPATIPTSKGTQPPKASVGTGTMLPRPAVPSKSSLLNSSTTIGVQSSRSSTSSNSSNGLSSRAPPKSATGRRNPGGSSNMVTVPSGSIPKTLSRTAVRNKPSPSMLSPHLKSKVSSNVSSASSIGDWSSVSSSSSSTVMQKFNNSRTSIDASSSRSTDGDIRRLHSRNPSADQASGGHQTREVNLASNIPKKASTTGAVQASTKPSGLRMPSPKIGFFDGAKSSPHTPNGHRPSQLALPKHGAASSPSRISNGKLKGTKTPTTSRMSTSRASSKPDSPKITSVTSSKEKLNASINSSSVSLDVKGNDRGEECQKGEKVKVGNGVKEAVVDAIGNGKLGELIAHEDIKASKVADLGCVSENGVENNSDEAEKENVNEKYPGEGTTGYTNGLIESGLQ